MIDLRELDLEEAAQAQAEALGVETALLLSCALSLKRIADMLEAQAIATPPKAQDIF